MNIKSEIRELGEIFWFGIKFGLMLLVSCIAFVSWVLGAGMFIFGHGLVSLSVGFGMFSIGFIVLWLIIRGLDD